MHPFLIEEKRNPAQPVEQHFFPCFFRIRRIGVRQCLHDAFAARTAAPMPQQIESAETILCFTWWGGGVKLHSDIMARSRDGAFRPSLQRTLYGWTFKIIPHTEHTDCSSGQQRFLCSLFFASSCERRVPPLRQAVVEKKIELRIFFYWRSWARNSSSVVVVGIRW